jgi:hypothetical protein
MEAAVAEQYRRTNSKKKHHKWTANLIKQLWEIQFRLWEHRNNVEHHHMTPAKQQQLNNLLARANDELHQGCVDLLPTDRHLFADHDKVLSSSLDDLRLWLKDVELARKTVDDVRIKKREEVARSRAAMYAWLASRPLR